MFSAPLLACVLWLVLSATAFAQDSLTTAPNSLEVSLRLETYPEAAERSYLHLQYGRKFGKTEVFARTLRYSIVKNGSWLFEADSYVRYSKNGNLYVTAGGSASEFLPNFRTHAEVFRNWRSLEYSVGGGWRTAFAIGVAWTLQE